MGGMSVPGPQISPLVPGSEPPRPPGWYQDPTYDHLERWWTGTVWTADIRELHHREAIGPELTREMLAGPGSRFLAWLLDSLVISILSVLAAIPALGRIWNVTWAWANEHMAAGMNQPTSPTDLPPVARTDIVWVFLAGFVCCMLYYFFLLHFSGRTLGQRAVGIRTAPKDDIAARGLSWDSAGKRAMSWAILTSLTVVWLPAWAFGLFSSLLVFSHPWRQTWPDLLAKCVVIRSQH